MTEIDVAAQQAAALWSRNRMATLDDFGESIFRLLAAREPRLRCRMKGAVDSKRRAGCVRRILFRPETPILEPGGPDNLELVVDLLARDAAQVAGWGEGTERRFRAGAGRASARKPGDPASLGPGHRGREDRATSGRRSIRLSRGRTKGPRSRQSGTPRPHRPDSPCCRPEARRRRTLAA